MARADGRDVDVVIPAFNESTRLPETLRETVRFLSGMPWPCTSPFVS